MKPSGPSFDDLIARLDLTRKVLVLTGRDFWSTWPLPEIGLRSMVMSDGPSGVRGPVWDERSPSLNLPSASALASAWDPDLARAYGAVAAAEARRKGVDVVLGPTINLHRSPLGGRHFEAFSEDPVLTAQLAAAYITGLQTNGVGATPKHYVANDSETERFTLDAEVSARALRELYLLPFEEAVVDADAWLVMSAYNAINGATATENALLAVPLNEEWEFDGVVVSDWGAVRSINAARHEQDLAMPGPDGPWGSALVEAVESGDVPRQAVDRKVRRLLQLAARVGALEGFEPPPAPQHVDGPSFARRAAAEGTVLLANDGILPVTTKPKMIAVIGHNALVARSQGGGSATVVPERVVSPLEGIQEAFPDAAIRFALGAVVQSGVSALPLGQLRNPSTGGAGARVRFLDATGEVIFEEDRFASSLTWLGSDVPLESSQIVELTTDWTPSETRTVRLGFSGVGHGIIRVRGAVLLDCVTVPVGTDLGAAILTPPSQSAHIDVEAGVPLRVTFELERATAGGALAGALSLTLGLETEDSNPDELIEQAEAAAREADLVVLVVGTNAQVESEGHDRTDLRLPGHQDRLAQAVLSANRRTVVVVNAGAPVELPWASRAAALMIAWFGGQECGHALGDILTGAAEPGGRLPTTWPRSLADAPVSNVLPAQGVLPYDEGIHIGYRGWLRSKAEPAYWFGAGQGYTTFEVSDLAVSDAARPAGHFDVAVFVRNTGARRGKHVVQVYASRPASAVDRPMRWLVGFRPVVLDPAESTRVVVSVPSRALAYWSHDGWTYEPGEFMISVAGHAGDPGLFAPLELTVPKD